MRERRRTPKLIYECLAGESLPDFMERLQSEIGMVKEVLEPDSAEPSRFAL
jgi:hypothetical protein